MSFCEGQLFILSDGVEALSRSGGKPNAALLAARRSLVISICIRILHKLALTKYCHYRSSSSQSPLLLFFLSQVRFPRTEDREGAHWLCHLCSLSTSLPHHNTPPTFLPVYFVPSRQSRQSLASTRTEKNSLTTWQATAVFLGKVKSHPVH